VKTSTGLGPRGATLEDIYLLRSLLPPEVGIKASGGISSARFAWDLINAGASRIGTSSAEKIILESIDLDL
jgi:deoxyribose-phosphate aldolase